MRAVELSAFSLDGLSTVERPEPRVAGDQVRVRIRAASLNRRDWDVIHGYYDPAMPLPRVLLSDGAGEVVETGPEVTRFRVGDRVTTMMTTDWITGPYAPERSAAQLGTRLDGVLQESIVLPERALVRMPEHLDFIQASTLPIAALTAWSALCEASLKPGDSVLVQGTGGVSLFALQLAKHAGARVIATSTHEDRLERLRALGADHALVSRGEPESLEAIVRASGGRGVDLVIDVVGASAMARHLTVLRPGGMIARVGLLGVGQPIEEYSMAMLYKAARVQAIVTGSRERYEQLVRALELHRIVPVVDRVFAFQDHGAALTYLGSGRHIGKVVITV